MKYKTIFGTKPQKENKRNFCNRICRFLDQIEYYSGSGYFKGYSMLNTTLRSSNQNPGYYDVDDLLKEANYNYSNIYTLSRSEDVNISEFEILANIEIIANCVIKEEPNLHGYFDKGTETQNAIKQMSIAINEYLLSLGYKLVDAENVIRIVESGIAINIDEITDTKIKNEVSNFYDYRIENNTEEKRKIIVNVLSKLENRKTDIENLFGKKIADVIFNYANNINLRHDNTTASNKSNFNIKVAELSEEELVNWYNYIFTFVINVYLSLDVLKNINVNNGYKE